MSTAHDGEVSLSLGPNYRKLWSSAAVSSLADGIFVWPCRSSRCG